MSFGDWLRTGRRRHSRRSNARCCTPETLEVRCLLASFVLETVADADVATSAGSDDDVKTGDLKKSLSPAVVGGQADSRIPGATSSLMVSTEEDHGTVQLLSPTGITTDARPVIEWMEFTEAVSYELWLQLLGSNDNPIVNPTITATSFTPDSDLPIGRYIAWVRANLSDGGVSDWGTIRFEVRLTTTLSPLPPHLTDLTPQFSWADVHGAVSYRLYVSNITTQQNGVIDIAATGTNYFPPNDLGFGRYRWWVQTLAAGNHSSGWSQVGEFNVGPQLTAPLVPTRNDTPAFSWTTLPGIATFQLYVSHGGEVVLNQSGLTETQLTPSDPLIEGDYRWWIRPFTDTGRAGGWSETGTFNVGGRPVILTPDSDDTSGIPQISWRLPDFAATSEIYVYNDTQQELTIRRNGIVGNIFQMPLPDGDYRVWLRSFDTEGMTGGWSRVRRFAVNAVGTNLTATPTSPDNPTFDLTPTFSWVADFGSVSVDVFLRSSNAVVYEPQRSGAAWTPTVDLTPDVWEWWVRARNAADDVGPWNTVVRRDLSGRAVVLGPVGSTADRRSAISWSEVARASRYVLQLDNLTTNEDSIIRENSLSGIEYLVPNDLTPGTYRAWVRAINSAGNVPGPWSLAHVFDVV